MGVIQIEIYHVGSLFKRNLVLQLMGQIMGAFLLFFYVLPLSLNISLFSGAVVCASIIALLLLTARKFLQIIFSLFYIVYSQMKFFVLEKKLEILPSLTRASASFRHLLR